VRYFSKLSAMRERETNRFLRQILASLIYNASEFDLVKARTLDLQATQTSIETLLDTFLASGAKAIRDKLKAHFELAAKALEERPEYKLDELVALAAVLPMQKIVEQWNSTQLKQEALAKPRIEFIDIINGMFHNKRLVLNERNELEAVLPSEKHLLLSDLSSGEKQLLILFAEALLQEKSEYIYIADEPELSLHVSWQEQLTRNLLRINPNAQVIFATHSPDIVSQYGDHAFDMEKLIS
jgi:predicted ATP-dependent endonuclease of OLD family